MQASVGSCHRADPEDSDTARWEPPTGARGSLVAESPPTTARCVASDALRAREGRYGGHGPCYEQQPHCGVAAGCQALGSRGRAISERRAPRRQEAQERKGRPHSAGVVTQAGFEPATPSSGGWVSKSPQPIDFTMLFLIVAPVGLSEEWRGFRGVTAEAPQPVWGDGSRPR